jgi:predicted DCC family thiol-disulfide oxidoreductase YuxK
MTSELPTTRPESDIRYHPHRVSDFADLGVRLLVIYDGRCGFCNRSVRWFLRRDRHDRLRFIPSESPRVADLLVRHSLPAFDSPASSDTMVVVRNPGTPAEQIYLRSDAAAALLAELPHQWLFLGGFFRLIPRPIRDLGYLLIARIRYRVRGRYDTCPIPTPAERAHFL